MTLDYLVK